MKKLLKILPPLLGVVVLVVLILWMSGVFIRGRMEPGKLAAPEGLPAPAKILQVTVEPTDAWYEAVGTVRSRIQATVAPQITGRLLDVKVNVGDTVREGDLLVLLDNREYQARLEQARSALAAAQAGKEQADAAFQRVKNLFDKQAATSQELERGLARKKQADAEVLLAEEKVNEAQTYMGYARLLSPLDGVVADRLADPGDLAYPGKPLIVVHNPGDLRLEASVREGLIARVRGVKERGEKVEVGLEALKKTVRGEISEIVPSADPVSRSFLVKVSLPGTEGLYPGMFGKLRIQLDPRPAVYIPNSAVTRVGQLTTVRVQEDGRWVRRYVTLGAFQGRREERVEILSGLRGGETIGLD